MNKEVVYIEPEDDITDIISKIKQTTQKVVALVPPKKVGVLRSAVNTKLIAKTAKSNEKIVVLVTADPSLMKLAMGAQLPVAKTLQSRPVVPTEDDIEPSMDQSIETIDEKQLSKDEGEEEEVTKKAPAKKAAKAKVEKEPDQEINSAEIENEIEKEEKELDDKENKKSKKSEDKNKKIPDFSKKRKFIIAGVVAGILLIAFIVWANVFAPASVITVEVRTTTNNFSEGITLTRNASLADPQKGIFLLEEQTAEKESKVDFEATGEKDVGEKAKGVLTLSYGLTAGAAERIPAGTAFAYGDLNFITSQEISFVATDETECYATIVAGNPCNVTKNVTVTAQKSGAKYNIGSHSASEWTSPSGFGAVKASNTDPFSGGTDKVITIVQQSDIDKAKEKLASSSDDEGKNELKQKFGDDMIILETSFKKEEGDLVVSPKVGEEAKDKKANISAKTKFTLFAVDKTQIEDYIKSKSTEKLADDQKVYQIDTTFFEGFVESAQKDNYTAKLKATTQSGPKITEADVMEKAKGKRNGEVQTLIKSINGVSKVKVEGSFFWVNSVPNDENKVKIELTVEK